MAQGEAPSAFQAPTVEVSKIEVSPNQCEISSPITLKVEFTVDKPLANASWEIKVRGDRPTVL